MTNDQLEKELEALTEYVIGSVTAITFAIQAMQEQPGFDSRRFVQCMASFQVQGEERQLNSGVRRHVDATIAALIKGAARVDNPFA